MNQLTFSVKNKYERVDSYNTDDKGICVDKEETYLFGSIKPMRISMIYKKGTGGVNAMQGKNSCMAFWAKSNSAEQGKPY